MGQKRTHTKLAHTPFSSSYVFYPRYFIDFGVSVSAVVVVVVFSGPSMFK